MKERNLHVIYWPIVEDTNKTAHGVRDPVYAVYLVHIPENVKCGRMKQLVDLVVVVVGVLSSLGRNSALRKRIYTTLDVIRACGEIERNINQSVC